jgi:hypothetical protein
MLATLLSLTLSCLSADDGEARVASAKKTFTLDVQRGRMTLLEGDAALPDDPGIVPKGLRWVAHMEQHIAGYVVSDDGSWVVAARDIPRFADPEQGVVILFDEKGQSKEVDILPSLTAEERKLLGHTNCGTVWFANARDSGTGVEVDIYQSSTPFEPSWFATVRIERSTLALTRVASPKPKPEKAAPAKSSKKKKP